MSTYQPVWNTRRRQLVLQDFEQQPTKETKTPRSDRRRRLLGPLFQVCCCLVWVLSGSWVAAQEAAISPLSPTRVHLGAGECFRCHNNGFPKVDGPEASLLAAFAVKKMVNDKWVSLKEWSIWGNDDKHDKHSQAFTSLLNERSKIMGKLLGNVEIHRDKRCLACHTSYPLSAMAADLEWMPAELAEDPRVALGVSCEGCHSPSGDAERVTGWFKPHIDKDGWRFLSAADKRDKFGFTDIRSTSARTRMCLSCHLGNVSEGKIVTHEMYAAGHPPLPGFELSTFVFQMPKHWLDFDKKGEAVRNEFLKRNADDIYGRDSYKVDNLHETRASLVAGLISYSENLKLVRSLADGDLKAPVQKPDWPELAQFECFACHHDLKDHSWRQRRRLRGAPGRPMLRAWPTSIAKLALKTAGQDPQELDRRIDELENRLSVQPFGGREQWAKTIKPASDWLDEQATKLEKTPLPRGAGLSVLRDIATLAGSDFWDYDSARQLVWVTQVLRRELATDQNLRARMTALESDLAPLETMFVLDLTAGRVATQQFPGDTARRKVSEVDLEKTLPPIANYDAVTFRERFRKLAAKLE